MSGLSHTPGKRARGKTLRGFESPLLRQHPNKHAPSGAFCFCSHQSIHQSDGRLNWSLKHTKKPLFPVASMWGYGSNSPPQRKENAPLHAVAHTYMATTLNLCQPRIVLNDAAGGRGFCIPLGHSPTNPLPSSPNLLRDTPSPAQLVSLHPVCLNRGALLSDCHKALSADLLKRCG
jgi:hypothetical protein